MLAIVRRYRYSMYEERGYGYILKTPKPLPSPSHVVPAEPDDRREGLVML